MHFRLIYSSVASSGMTEADFRTIAMFAAMFNGAHDITGLLLTHNDQIMQVLEGEEDKVRTLFERIKRDKRHHDVKVLTEGDCETPEFDSWSMGYRPLNQPLEIELFFSLSSSTLNDILPDTSAEDVQQHIRDFANKTGANNLSE